MEDTNKTGIPLTWSRKAGGFVLRLIRDQENYCSYPLKAGDEILTYFRAEAEELIANGDAVPVATCD
jgi:hypothetical protein